MWRIAGVFAVLIAIVVASLASDPAQQHADFTFINRGDLSTLDLQKMSWMQDLRMARLLSEGLTRKDIFDPEYRVVPAAAERWEVSPDGRTYRFRLRPSACWSNGAPLRADDFVYAWRRALLPEIGCDYVAQYQLIKGAKAFFDWRLKRLEEIAAMPDGPQRRAEAAGLWAATEQRFAETVGVRSLEEGRVLEVELERPTPYFLDLCAFAVFFPVYPPLVSQYEHADPQTGRLDSQPGWTKAGVNITNGPFVLEAWRFKRDVRLKKSPTYWNRDAIAIDSVTMLGVEDGNAQVLAFTTGSVDWVSDVTPAYRRDMLEQKRAFYDEVRRAHQAWAAAPSPKGSEPPDVDAMIAQGLDPVLIDSRLPHDPRKNIHAFPAFGTYFFNFNCLPKLRDGRDNPFFDPRVRRAFAMTVDKQRIVRDIRGVGEPATSTLIPAGAIPGYASPKGLPFDPERARALLAEAGYPGGKGFPGVEVLVNKEGGHDVIAQAMAKDWHDHLGVSVSLAVREIKVFRNDLKQQNFMISRAGWFGDYGDPTTFLEINRDGDGNNDRKYKSERYESLLNAARDEADPAKRLAILSEAERVIVEEDLPLIPIYQYVQMYLFDPDKISGISSHIRQEQNLFLIDRLGDGKGPDTMKHLPPKPRADSAARQSS